MAKDVADNLSYYLVIDEMHKEHLRSVRKWTNLKVAFDGGWIWMKDFDYAQIHSVEVKSIPWKQLFYEQGGKLFLLNSLLPERNLPALLWTPVDRALPVRLPSYNFNYFGIDEKLRVQLVPSDNEQKSEALIISVDLLDSYLEDAPAIRLKNLRWTLLGTNKALVMGTPLLPLSAEAFWLQNNFIIPAGYIIDLNLLTTILDELLNPEKDQWVLWNTDNTYALIDKSDLEPLTRGSFQLTRAAYFPQ